MRSRRALSAILTVVAWCAFLPETYAQEPALESADFGDELPASDQPIVIELAQGIDLLNDQITAQQQLLATAQSDRERQLIQNHIRLLQKERRSLEGLLHKLIGPEVDILDAAREQQAEHRAERSQKILDERTPNTP